MPNLKGIKPGEELVRVPKDWRRGRRGSLTPKTVRVHKVGHTLVHVLRNERNPDGPTDAYRIENGIANDGYSSAELWRLEDWAVEQRREEVEAALRKHGVEVWRKRQPVPVLEAILAVLEGES